MRLAPVLALAGALLLFASMVRAQDPGNETADPNETADRNVTDDERRRLPSPVLIAGAIVAALLAFAVVVLARRPRPPAP